MYEEEGILLFDFFQFYDSWKDLVQWLREAEQALNSENTVSNEPDKIKLQISKHKVGDFHISLVSQ